MSAFVILFRTGRSYRVPGQRSCQPHPHALSKEDWDRIRGSGNPTTAQAEGYSTARHDPTTGRVVATIYPAIRNPAFIRRIKSKKARHFFTRAFMAQEITRRASPEWAEALVTPNVNKPPAAAEVDHLYKERYRNEHFENTVLRTLLGLPMRNAGDDLNYRPADSYPIQLQKCPWGRQVPPGWTPENDDYDPDDKEQDSGPPPLVDNWDDEVEPQHSPRGQPAQRDQSAPRHRSGARNEERGREESSRHQEHRPRESRRDRGEYRDTSRRDQSSRGDRPRARGRERGQDDQEPREHREHRGCYASPDRDSRSQRGPSQGRNRRSRREPS